LNSRHPKGEGRKAPLTVKNQPIWERTMLDMKKCLLGLKNKKGVPILDTALKTGPLGFLIALESVRQIMHELVCTDIPKLK